MTTELMALQEQIQKELKAQQSTLPVGASSTAISTKDKKFTLPDGTVSEGPMDAIILDWRWTNAYFEGVWNPSNPKPPVCSAKGKDANTMSPDAKSDKPQNETCEGCAMNEWGSGNGNGKACKNGLQIAVIPANPTELMTPWTMNLAPTTIKDFVGYVEGQQARGVLPLQVITSIDFDASTSYVKLTFGDPRPHEFLATAMGLRTKAQKLLGAA